MLVEEKILIGSLIKIRRKLSFRGKIIFPNSIGIFVKNSVDLRGSYLFVNNQLFYTHNNNFLKL